MSFFGIGPMELAFILIIMILVLGPKNMVSAARSFGATLRKIVKSPLWNTVMDTSREIRELPNRLMREAAIDEDIKEIKATTDSLKDIGDISVITTPAVTSSTYKPKKRPTSGESDSSSEIPENEENKSQEGSESLNSNANEPEKVPEAEVPKDVPPDQSGEDSTDQNQTPPD